MITGAYTILIAEDDSGIREALQDSLTAKGFNVLSAEDGATALWAVRERNFDLALLDVAMPKADGFQVLSHITKERPGTPVIMLTARGEEDDRIMGLQLGADDYIVKPFSIRELIARIEAVLRRSPERARPINEISLPNAQLDSVSRQITFNDGTTDTLTKREFDLLSYLATHPNRIITRDELLRRIWNVDPRITETRSVEMTITRLREKLGSAASCLETLRAQGYRWNPPIPS